MTVMPSPWQVLAFDSKVHDRTAFSCGAAELDRYLREHASQDIKRDVARVFVAVRPEATAICGYYSLSATSFQRDELSADQARKLPRYPVPSVLLGRLAVDRDAQGAGLGEFLLMDAMYRTLLATQVMAVHAMVVDAKNASAAKFYRKYGFIAFPNNTQRLFLPVATIRQLQES
ncbi:GNAT family N-acetyltransferase [Castellaniella sp.]|uniref:GNAT family N-acetyltransferase n=1 Tax=Castellaniella sp. TaxID=1955812 RepID=UPI003A8D3C7B